MKELRKHGRINLPSVVLWREDLVALEGVVRSLSPKGFAIRDGAFEYDSMEEFLANKGPTPRSLEILTRQPYLSIEMSRRDPWIYRSQSDETDAVLFRLEEFFKSKQLVFGGLLRPSIPAVCGYLFWSVMCAISVTAIIATKPAFPSTWHFNLLTAVSWIIGIMIVSSRGRVTIIRNYAKHKRAFDDAARRRDLLDKLIIGSAGIVLGILAKAIFDGVVTR
jgi:hypothetical protein